MSKIQYYGIAFPISIEKEQGLFDLNFKRSDMVKSQLIHLLFTPEGERLRNPEFGTKLIAFIFQPNDELLWDDVLYHLKEKVKRFIPGCEINDILIDVIDDGRGINVTIMYSVVEEDGMVYNYELTQTI